MPRYFFHTADGSRERDTEGTELADNETARVAAIRYAGDLLRDEPAVLSDGLNFRVEVTNAQELLFTIIILTVDAPVAIRG